MRGRRVTYNIICNLLLQIITIIYGFIVPKIIISHYGSNINGLVSSITQFLGYIALLESGVGPVIKASLYKPLTQKKYNEISGILLTSEKFFKSISKIFVLYIIVLLIIYPLFIAQEFSYIYTASLIVIIAFSTFAEYYFGMTYKLLIQANQRSYVISIIQSITYILAAFFVVLLSRLNISIHFLKLLCSIIFASRPILQNIYVKKKFNINFSKSIQPVPIKQKWDGMAQHIANVIHNGTDVTLLSIFCSFSEVSVYSAYALVVKGIKSLITSFTNGMDSIFGEMFAKGEKNLLNQKFNIYETTYMIICNTIFSCTLVLITPFITIYTAGFNDANYIRYTFALLLVVSEYIWAIRLPYNSLIMSAGMFKETKKGAWVESFLNLSISLILIKRYGLIGVTVGSTVAMLYRTIEFVIFSQKRILFRSLKDSFKKIILLIVNTIIVFIVYKYLPLLAYTNYFNWVINSLIVFIISSIVIISIFYSMYSSDLKELINFIKKRLWGNKK